MAKAWMIKALEAEIMPRREVETQAGKGNIRRRRSIQIYSVGA